jgi:hypothetical protein
MSESLKIAVLGDYNFTYNSHQATNLAIDHASRFLDDQLLLDKNRRGCLFQNAELRKI